MYRDSNPERADNVKKNSPVDYFLVGCRADGYHEQCGVVVKRENLCNKFWSLTAHQTNASIVFIFFCDIIKKTNHGSIAMKRCDIRVRDPFILRDDEIYYMYATSGERTLSYYRSKDLENWEEGKVVFEIPEDFWAYKDVWAGEVHKYKEKYYLFVSLLGKNGLRGTQIAVSDRPDGVFEPIVDRAVTPSNQSCIDGTLFVQDGNPFILYSHDWPDNYVKEKEAYVGEIWCSELTEDLTSMKGDVVRLFASDEVPLSKAAPCNTMWDGSLKKRYGSDAPFVQKLSDGTLYLTWSPYLEDHYAVLGAISKTGSVFGPWEHLDRPLFEDDGGHAMFFDDATGSKIMCIHAPERNLLERAHLYYIAEEDGFLIIVDELTI